MNDKTVERLYAVGWKEERNINIDKLKTRYHEIGLNMPHVVYLRMLPHNQKLIGGIVIRV